MTGPHTAAPLPRATPLRVLGRLALVNGAALVLLAAVFTAPEIARALQFDPHAPTVRPWAALTYPFLHTGVIHLLGVTGLLFVVGPEVVRRMGGPAFVGYYLACAVGAAVFAVPLAGLLPVPPMAGGLAPTLGVVLARGWLSDDEEIALNPLPLKARVRTLVALAAIAIVIVAALARSSAVSVAHAGGLLAGYLWLRVRSGGRRPATATSLPIRRPVMTPVRLEVQESSAAPAPASPPSPAPGSPAPRAAPSEVDELDRLLDKISAHGLESLTAQERRQLAEYAARKRKEGP